MALVLAFLHVAQCFQVSSMSYHVSISVLLSFSWLNNISSNGYITFCFCIHQMMYILILRFFVTMNNARMNNQGQVSCESMSVHLSVDQLGHMVTLFKLFQELKHVFPKWLHHFTFPSTMFQGSKFSSSLLMLAVVQLFYYSHLSVYEVIFHCDLEFDIISLTANNVKHLFMYWLVISTSSLERYSNLLPI